MRRKHRYRRYLLWGAITGALFDALWWYASREPPWIQSYYNAVTSSWDSTGYPETTGVDWS
jgi:Na+/melibiose symporter-like transporter